MLDTWLTRRSLKKTIKEFRPDAIVSVYPLASLVLGRMRRKKQLRVPVLTYLTDFAVHSLWVHKGIDRHLAVSEISAQTAESRGGKQAVARGPLVSDRFREVEYDRDAVRTNLGLAPDERAVLVVAGSWGVGDVIETVEAIGRSGEFHPITVCGTRRRPARPARGARLRHRHRLDRRDARAHGRVRRAGRERRRPHVHGGVRGRSAGHHVPADRRPRQGQRRDHVQGRGQLLRPRRGRAAHDPALGHRARRGARPPGRHRPPAVRRRSRERRRGARRRSRSSPTVRAAPWRCAHRAAGAPRGSRPRACSCSTAGSRSARRPSRPRVSVWPRRRRTSTHTVYVGRAPRPRSSSATPTCSTQVSDARRLGRRRCRRGAQPPRRARAARGEGRRHRQRRHGPRLVPALEPRAQRRRQGRASSWPRKPGRRRTSSARSAGRRVRPVLRPRAQAEARGRQPHGAARRTCPTHLENGKVYLLDGRQRDATAMEVAIADLVRQAEHDGLHVATYGELR